ncbi:MAG: hypothetical protein GX235_12165 [Clostridiales bacterium]|mgnify:CR=1 FL=1|nr:hypothetical protein [Clostridiales bacterium]
MEYEIGELFPIVKRLTDKYTSKESSSVTYEKAEQLMGAVLYCIRERDKKLQNAENTENMKNAEKAGKTELDVVENAKISAVEAYNEGYQLVIHKAERAKMLYEEIIEDFDSYGNLCYYDTIGKGMPEFFVHYDARFFPQNHILTLDYPLLIDTPSDLCGIDLIYSYLRAVWIEQRFLGVFPRSYVIEALREYHRCYEELILNICSVVIRNIVGRMLAEEKEVQKLSVEMLENKMMELLKTFMRQEYVKREDKGFCEVAENYLSQDMHSFAVEYKNILH